MNDEELIPISALQHVLFCERQYALIHLEQLWEENRFTAEGRVLHERVDEVRHESRKDSRVEFGLSVRSLQNGLIGKCDLVEFEERENEIYKKIIPVEFKRGRSKADDYDLVQLCAQALCLEEMFSLQIGLGQIYYLQEHRRTTVTITETLREKTLGLVDMITEIRKSGVTPAASYKKEKCDRCSLVDKCMPKILKRRGSINQYVTEQINKVSLDD
jgi:CRISPR-associated exonuclease Cas4